MANDASRGDEALCLDPCKDTTVAEEVDFIITDYLQRLEMWAFHGSRSGLDVAAITSSAERYSAAVLVPVCGKAVQKLGTFGFEPDGFMLQVGSFRFAALTDLEGAAVTGWLPEQHGADVEVTARCLAASRSRRFAPGTLFSLELPLEIASGTEHEFRIELSAAFQPAALPGGSNDTRLLGCLIQSVEFLQSKAH